MNYWNVFLKEKKIITEKYISDFSKCRIGRTLFKHIEIQPFEISFEFQNHVPCVHFNVNKDQLSVSCVHLSLIW